MPRAPADFVVALGEPRPAQGSKPSASRIYRHSCAAAEFPSVPVSTLYDLFSRSAQQFAEQPCLGHRPFSAAGDAGEYVWATYAEVAADVAKIASGLAGLGVKPQDRVGIYAVNSPEWMVAMQACNRMSYECVPLYDSLGENAVEYIVRHSGAVAVFAQSTKLAKLAAALAGVPEQVKVVVYWGAADSADIKTLEAQGTQVLSYAQMLQAGAAAPADAVPPKPEDIATIMYTSGTTGDPKGVLITHANLVSEVAGLNSFLTNLPNLSFGPGDSVLSFLPLAHIFDRACEELMLFLGARIGYFQGNVAKLVDDIGTLKPTMFIGVPRVFDRIYHGVIDQINHAGGVKKLLFNYAFGRKLYYLKHGFHQDKAAPFFDRLVFSKIKQRLGGRVRLVVSGGAPLASHVEDFLRVAMCAPVVQGYGLTETCAGSCIAIPDVIEHSGTSGPPLPNTELRFESVPEMGYDALNEELPAGEILLRGPSLFSGYYKDEEKTKEAVDEDGWFHTGDIGVLTSDGAVKIVDRKKNIFKLSQGEYIAVEKLEAVYKKAPPVEQVWVYGDSFKSTLVAVVVPKEKALQDWANEEGLQGDAASLCQEPKARAWILDQLTAAGKADKLKGFEMVKAVHLDSQQFSVENDLMTPTFKLKRPQLKKHYQAEIDAMYEGESRRATA